MDFSAFETITAAKTGTAESKHYIPFSKPEWEELEKVAKCKLMPNRLKKMLQAIFAGKVELVTPEILAIYKEVCPDTDVKAILAERAAAAEKK
jgi:hypothetical protein